MGYSFHLRDLCGGLVSKMTKNQMALNFPINTDFSAENFMQNSGNKNALQAINNLQNNGDVVVIYGEAGTGKSHLVAMWQKMVVAVNFKDITNFSNQITHIYAEDLETLSKPEQEQLFHSFNHVKSINGALLVSSKIPPAQLDILPDIKSRLLLGEQIEITLSAPQEMAILLAKLAYDRQLELSPEVINYLLKRCERSPKILKECIAKLDKLSLEQKRKITVHLAREALA